MVLNVSTKREYVPKAFGNDKVPVAEQIKVEHFAPTIAIKEKLFPKVFKYDQKGEVTGEFSIDREKMLRAFIREIKNFTYKNEEDATIKIRTADDLLKGPVEFEELWEELYNYFQELLNSRVDEKN